MPINDSFSINESMNTSSISLVRSSTSLISLDDKSSSSCSLLAVE